MPWRKPQTKVSPQGFLHEYPLWFNGWLESVMLWIDFSENRLNFFSKNFLNFWSSAIEKQNIINLSCYESKSYDSVVLGDSKVSFLSEKEDAAFCPLFNCSLVIYGVAKSKKHFYHKGFSDYCFHLYCYKTFWPICPPAFWCL